MDRDYFGKDYCTTKVFPKKIFVNQLGYKPDSVKRGVITRPCTDFALKNEKGEVVYSGKVAHFGVDAASQDDVYVADFSDFTASGRYTLSVDGEDSYAFEIGDSVYHQLSIDLLRAYYYLRCGEDLTEEFAGEYTHPACHVALAKDWENPETELDVRGGWHDAGDYGRYVTPGATAVAHLLFAYQLYPEKFDKLHLNIPESGNGTPDILNECRVELEWMMKLQRPDGAVYHKATTQFHADFCMPQDDLNQLWLFPVSTIATADLAAICALASRVYKPFDPVFSKILLTTAVKSAKWLEANPEFRFVHPQNHGTGSYGEHDDKDNRFWAWTELYLSTGSDEYKAKMDASLASFDERFPYTGMGYGFVSGMGPLSYILSGREDELCEKYKASFLTEAENLTHICDSCGWGAAMTEHSYGWGSNMGLGRNGMMFAIADYILKSDKYKAYAQKQLDFLLGMNATGYSWVTGEGEFSVNYPHLRPAHADGIEKCMPGYVSGGPNRHRQDHVARALIPEGTPPMKCFIDEVGTYSVNEITIYWNSPFVFLAGYLE